MLRWGVPGRIEEGGKLVRVEDALAAEEEIGVQNGVDAVRDPFRVEDVGIFETWIAPLIALVVDAVALAKPRRARSSLDKPSTGAWSIRTSASRAVDGVKSAGCSVWRACRACAACTSSRSAVGLTGPRTEMTVPHFRHFTLTALPAILSSAMM